MIDDGKVRLYRRPPGLSTLPAAADVRAGAGFPAFRTP